MAELDVLMLMGSASDWKHLKGAVRVMDDLGLASRVKVSSAHRTPDLLMEYAGMVAPDMEIMVYCSGTLCDESLQVSRFLVEQGFTNVVLFAQGFDAWTAAGYPTEAGW